MEVVDEHIATVLFEWVRVHGNGVEGSFTPKTATESLKAQFGIVLSEETAAQVLNGLAKDGLAKKKYSPLTNGFFSLNVAKIRSDFNGQFVKESMDHGTIDPDDTDLARAFPVINAYLTSGKDWINFVVVELQTGNHFSVEGASVPASDRIVTLNHNQVSELEFATGELLETVEAENSIEDDTSLRLRFLGQIKAGRELIRAQTLNAYLLYQTLMSMLAQLIQKYQGHAIGETAKQLWGLLLKHIFTGQ
jgi:hypothetical protein